MDKCFHSRTSCSGIWRRCYTSPITTFFRSTLPLPRPASFHPPHLEPGNSVRASLPLQCPCRSPVVLYVPFHGVDCTNKPLSQLLSSSFTVALALIMEVSPPLWPSCRQPLASHHHHLAWFLLCNLLFPVIHSFQEESGTSVPSCPFPQPCPIPVLEQPELALQGL